MVSVSVRRNPREPVGRNAQPRNPVHPHPENPGLIEQVDGFYDWAGRRLFLEDGSPDPATPGAYRYQTRPDLCDLAAPDSDPASPRYEPPHLRHKPGDTWIIDRDRPHDPDDPGSFGSPGWRPDPRTGRHRRDELPDPIPPWEAGGAAQDDAEETAGQADGPEAGGGEPPWRPRRRTSTPAPEPEPEPVAPPAPYARPGLSITPDLPEATPRRSPRFWQEESDNERSGSEAAQEESWRFEKLREDAWDRFVIKSSELAAAHWSDRRSLNDRHRRLVTVLLQLFRWVVAVFKGRRENEASAPGSAPQPLPRQFRPQSGREPHSTRPVPGAQMAQAIRSVQAARGAAHWRGRPREECPRPSPLPYISRWEQAFDGHRAFGEVAVL